MKILKPISFLGAMVLGAALSGCLNDSGSSQGEGVETRLVITAGVKDVNKVGGALSKTSVITLRKLIVTLKSSVVTDPVIRDTVLADTGSFHSSAIADQSIIRNYAIKPLRSWTVVVKTLDVKDSVIHYDSVVATNLFAGETRQVQISPASRYVMYEALFTVPDSLRSTTPGTFAQKLLINRFVMVVDGKTVVTADSTSKGGFVPGVVHSVRFDYIRTNTTPTVQLQFYGRVVGGPNDTLMFQQTIVDVNPANPPPTGTAQYVGPGANGTGGGFIGLTISIGKVGTVTFNPGFEVPNL